MKLFFQRHVFCHLLADWLYIFNIAASQAAAFSHKLVNFFSGFSRLMRIYFFINCVANLVKFRNNHAGISYDIFYYVLAVFHLL